MITENPQVRVFISVRYFVLAATYAFLTETVYLLRHFLRKLENASKGLAALRSLAPHP